jgi:hypothetical protein
LDRDGIAQMLVLPRRNQQWRPGCPADGSAGRRGVGKTEQGFIVALVKVSQAALALLVASLQQAATEVARDSC